MESTNEQSKQTQRLMGDILDDLAQIRGAKARVQDSLTEITAKETLLREELLNGMSTAGIKSGTGAGLTATVKTRKSALVIDQVALVEALDERGLLPEYLKLDSTKAAKYGATHGLPGAVFDEMSYLSVSEVK